MKFTQISYITLWATKFDEMVVFYRDQLGLLVEYADDNFIQFVLDGTKLYLHKLGTAPQLRDHTVEIHFDVPNVDVAFNELKTRGIEFEDPPANRPWGARMAAFRDPEGYSVEIVGPLDPTEPVPTY